MRRITTRTAGRKAKLHSGLIYAIATLGRLVRYRGVQRLSWAATRVFPSNDEVLVQISDDTRLAIRLGDGYWTKLLSRNYVYEREVATFLDRVLDKNAYFVDCGANIGYWTMLCRNRAKGVVAVEASPTTYLELQKNAALNKAEVRLVNAAVWHADGQMVTIFGHPLLHAGARVEERATRQETGGWVASEVPTITLRTLIRDYCVDETAPIIIKLDVEGAEVAALKGAGTLLADRDVVIIYEDHGADPTCEVSRYVETIGMSIEDPTTGARLSIADVGAQKTQAWRGYNFVARHDGPAAPTPEPA